MQANSQSSRSRPWQAKVGQLRRGRLWLICLFFVAWTGLIFAKLFSLQVIRHKEFVERAQKQQQRALSVPAPRGVLYDRNLRELAMTVKLDSVYAEPAELGDKAAAARLLAGAAHLSPDDDYTSEAQILARLNAASDSDWVTIARHLDPETSDRIHALNLKGLHFQKEAQRFYPNNETAAYVLGYVNQENTPLGGIEAKFDKQLRGTPGLRSAALDARRHVMGSTEREPEAGKDMVLTIDENIQFMAEKALDHAMDRTGAAHGTVVIQDVHTGQILALAVRPTFNPNQAHHLSNEELRDRAVTDVYEPGSVFKLVTYSAALDLHLKSPDDIIDCQGGVINLAGRLIHDDKSDMGMGKVTLTQALEKSSDVAAVKLALAVGPDRFYQYIRSFGFGSRTGIELPAETHGLLRKVDRWSASSIGSLAIGQEVAVTPVQLVSMVSAIANGGVYLPPRVLLVNTADSKPGYALKPQPFRPGHEPTPDPQNPKLANALPVGAHRVISTMTAAQMRKMMEQVVLFGTGRAAQLNGYSSGGKTGTAQKIDPATHTYSKTMHIASFAGFAPVNDPAIAVVVVMDSPTKVDYHAAAASAPVFAEVAQEVLEFLGVPHDIALKPTRPGAKPPGKPARIDPEDSNEDSGDLNALYEAVNDLPADDPLHVAQSDSQAPPASIPVSPPAAAAAESKTVAGRAGNRVATVAERMAIGPRNVGKSAEKTSRSAPDTGGDTEAVVETAPPRKVAVPAFAGLTLRKVVEQASAAGLHLQLIGAGIARQQAPAPGTMVLPGTEVVVRFGR